MTARRGRGWNASTSLKSLPGSRISGSPRSWPSSMASTAADQEAEVIVLEPTGVLNTGNLIDEKFTAPTGVKI